MVKRKLDLKKLENTNGAAYLAFNDCKCCMHTVVCVHYSFMPMSTSRYHAIRLNLNSGHWWFFRNNHVVTASEKLLSVWREMEQTALSHGQVSVSVILQYFTGADITVLDICLLCVCIFLCIRQMM